MKRRSAIKEMYLGVRGNYETIKLSKDCINLISKVSAKEETLLKKLKGKQEIMELYKNYKTALENAQSEAYNDYFCEGFRFGMLIGLDVINNNIENEGDPPYHLTF